MNKLLANGINQITLRVNEIDRAEHFYTEVLGFEVSKKMGRSMTVYKLGEWDTLVLVEAETSYDRSSKDYRVDHFGFKVEENEIIDQLVDYFKELEVTILSGPANRKNGRFVFISDPDGNMIEIYSDDPER